MKLFTDGGSRGNPGNAATGYFIFDENNKTVDFGGEYIGKETNNFAEYTALISGLKLAEKNKIKKIECFLDSELVVKQLKGEYKVKNENIKPLYNSVQQIASDFKEISFTHVPRAENKYADKMVNVILDSIAG